MLIFMPFPSSSAGGVTHPPGMGNSTGEAFAWCQSAESDAWWWGANPTLTVEVRSLHGLLLSLCCPSAASLT